MNVCCAVTGAPIVLSEPHFYQADPTYQRDIDGLTPNDSCVTYLDVEPVSNNTIQYNKIIYNAHKVEKSNLRPVNSTTCS